MPKNQSVMVPIPITEMINGSKVPVDLFIRLGEDKFICIAKSGSKTDKDRFSNYQNKTIHYLWVKKEQYGELVKSSLQIAGILVSQQNLTGKQKTKVLTNTAAAVFRQMDHMGLSFDAYSHSKQIVDATVTLSETHNDLFELFESLSECSDELLKHSMAVSCVSVMMAQAMNWDSRSTVEKLALGALLHDVGKKALPKDLIEKPKSKMSYDEHQLYETHPYKGMQMMVSLGIVPDDIISIVYEHHENALGQGFPRKLRNMKIHPLARIVALADEFVNLTLANPNCPVPKTAREALMIIDVTMGQPYNKECFRALQRVINKEIAAKKKPA